ncbi:MAG: hypothetical protein ABF271_02160 [Abyssibacter sp.]|uniref:hypothetical protein n=1 Tax=Abyssibacter sp. TaxID=2320200 RepID=UPI00321BC0B5
MLCLIPCLLLASPTQTRANDAVAASIGELLAYYFSIEEYASVCRVHARSAAPGVEGAFETWDQRNRTLADELQGRFAQLVSDDLKLDPLDTLVQNEVERNWRATRNAASRFQRQQLAAMETSQLHTACQRLNESLLTASSDIDQANQKAWETVFFRVPATQRSILGTWATDEDCQGELWTVRADGTDQVSLQTADITYGYKGRWTLARGLFRSTGLENSGTEVTMIGNTIMDSSGRLLTLEVTHQTTRAPGEDIVTTPPEDLYTVSYQRCPPGTQVAHLQFDARAQAAAPPADMPANDSETIIYARQPSDTDRSDSADVSRRPGRR